MLAASLRTKDTKEYIHVKPQMVRCTNPDHPVGSGRPCRRVLFRGEIPKEGIEIKCPKCKQLIRLQRL